MEAAPVRTQAGAASPPLLQPGSGGCLAGEPVALEAPIPQSPAATAGAKPSLTISPAAIVPIICDPSIAWPPLEAGIVTGAAAVLHCRAADLQSASGPGRPLTAST